MLYCLVVHEGPSTGSVLKDIPQETGCDLLIAPTVVNDKELWFTNEEEDKIDF